MIPGVDLIEFIKWGSIVAVALVIFAESGLLIGFFLPGDSLLFTTGYLIAADILQFNIHLAVIILFLAAVSGDSVGYWFGRKVGPALFKREDSRFFKKEHLHKAHDFYEHHGGQTIILARFIPIVRTFAPIVAGTAQMDYKKFLSFNVIGALLWAVGVTYAGYYLGKWFGSMGLEVDTMLFPIVALILLTSFIPPIYEMLKTKEKRTAAKAATKKHFKRLTRRK